MGMKCSSVGNLHMFSLSLAYRNLIKNIENLYKTQ